MIRLIRVMLRRRRAAAVAVLVLSAVAAAAAAAAPLYGSVATRAATQAQVAAAAPAEQAIARSLLVQLGNGPVGPELEKLTPALPYREGFQTVAGVQVNGRVTGPGAAEGTPAPLVYRSRICEHVRIVAGRCVAGADEVIVAREVARRLGLHVGAIVGFQEGSYIEGRFRSSVTDTRFGVVGLYEPGELLSAYGAGRSFAAGVTADGADGGRPLFATLETVTRTPFIDVLQTTDLVAQDGAFADLDRIRAVVAEETALADQNGYNASTGMAELAGRIGADRAVLNRSLQLAAVPLMLVTLVVLYLAVAASGLRRRTEVGLSGLRGVPGVTRWWLACAETVLPALAGAPLGLLAGWAVVDRLAAATLPGAPRVTITPASVAAAAAAVVAVLVLGALAQWQAARGPVAALLRRVPERRRAALAGVAEACVIVPAAGAGYQIGTGVQPGGVALLAPALVAVAVGLLARRITMLVADRAGRAALRRGRLDAAMFSFTVARRPSLTRLLALLVVLFGVVGFAVAAVAAGSAARTERARLDVGAPQVLTVRPMPAAQLLAAVRAADPWGRFATAVVRLRDARYSILAADTTRLCAIAYWSSDASTNLEQACALLRESPAGSLTVIAAQSPPDRIAVGDRSVPITVAARVPALPRLGAEGALADLGAVAALSAPGEPVREAQVWLARGVPPSVVAALAQKGVDVLGHETAAERAHLLHRSGPALALRFSFVASLAAVLLGLGGVLVVAAAEAEDETRRLRALRVQGMAAGSVWRQAFGGYAVLVVAAALAGTAAAAAAWWIAGGVVPLFAEAGYVPPVSALLPRPDLVAVAAVLQAVVLLVPAVGAAVALRRAVERSS